MLLVSSIFLLPNGTFFVELILFVIVLGIVGKVILPPIQQTLAERDRMIRSSLQAGEEGRSEADRLVAEREALLARARSEARARFDEVAQENEARRAEARDRGEAERSRLVAEATVRLEAEGRAARAAVLGDVADLAVSAASRVLGRPIDPARHESLLAEALAEATGSKGS